MLPVRVHRKISSLAKVSYFLHFGYFLHACGRFLIIFQSLSEESDLASSLVKKKFFHACFIYIWLFDSAHLGCAEYTVL